MLLICQMVSCSLISCPVLLIVIVDNQPPPGGATPQQDQPWLPVVEQLKGMGFDDDGGWLTELVKAKGNDIHKVLDALNHGN